ncbi:MAG: ATP-binding cassette domain-containing protein [Frankiaceae bacterium]|nr:ATP-binding cassette domain-containing protein [Frankiaceae bacterium]
MTARLKRVRDSRAVLMLAIAVGVLVAIWILLDFVFPRVISSSQTSDGHWQTPLPSVLLGLIKGSTYGMLAVGLVLIYRSNRIINFAHGEIGAFAAAFFGIEVLQWHIPFWVALLPALVVAGAIAMLIDAVVVRRLAKAPLVMSVVATLAAGQVLSLFALVVNSKANAGHLFPQPPGLPSFSVGKLAVTPSYFAILILAPLTAAGVGGFLKATRYGRAIRSAAANPDAARMAGIPVKRMSALAWAVAGVVAGLSAILAQAASGSNNNETTGPLLLLYALAGAVLGRFRSLPGALVGGLAVGVTKELLQWNSPDSGAVEAVLFLGIVVALLAQGQHGGRTGEKGAWSLTSRTRLLPVEVRRLRSVQVLERAPWLLLMVVLGGLPLLVSNATSIRLAISLAFVIVAMSIGIVTGLGGQLALGQFAIAAVGAWASFELSRRTGNFFASFAYAGLTGAAVSVALGIPAIRAKGLTFTVTTLAFALVVPDYLISRSWALGSGEDPGRPILFGHAFVSGHSYFYVALATFAVALLIARNVRRGGLGRRLIAVRDNEDAARAFTISVTAVKVEGYALAGFLAGLAGAMYGHALSQIGVDGFPATASIDAVKIAVIGGLGALSGPIFGAFLVQGPTYLTLGSLGLALFSLVELGVILYLPGGFVQFGTAVRDRVAGRLASRAGIDIAVVGAAERGVAPTTTDEPLPMPAVVRAAKRSPAPPGPVLETVDLHKSFGGIHAVRGLNLAVAPGETVGLIGPNGAGKTTTFELVAGFVRPERGTVSYRGVDITRTSPEARGRMGLIRSFQDAALFPTLTVAECVALSRERMVPTSFVGSLVGLRSRDRRQSAEADEILQWLGLSRYRASQIQELSTGLRRITELACLVALSPEVLLLDEPSSGVAQRETDALGTLLERLRSELRLTLIVIEHDIPLVMGLADRVVCMAEGEAIAVGTPAEIQADPRVIQAYLGSTASDSVGGVGAGQDRLVELPDLG